MQPTFFYYLSPLFSFSSVKICCFWQPEYLFVLGLNIFSVCLLLFFNHSMFARLSLRTEQA